jgi:alanine dehydrogenase
MALLLREEDVRTLLPMPDLIAAMRGVLIQYSSGRAEQPLRTVLELGDEKAFFGVMPAALTEPAAVGTKLVTVFASNRDRGLPSHLATIVLLDPRTGQLAALVDGRYITEARTGAVSAVSVDLLARGDAGVLAVIGSGIQARSHLEALACVRPLRDVRVWSPNESRRSAFAREMTPQIGASIRVVGSAREAVDGADMIVLATSSSTPVITSDWVGDGTHICAVGACRPTHREMDAALVARARAFVDSRVGAFAEAGDIVMALEEGVISRDHVAGELGEVAAGAVTGRESDRQVTLFKSLGMAVEDVAAAHLALDRARARGLGYEFVLSMQKH